MGTTSCSRDVLELACKKNWRGPTLTRALASLGPRRSAEEGSKLEGKPHLDWRSVRGTER
jgi:hypothetical protein